MSQLLLAGPGTVREFDFAERFPDPEGELHLRGAIRGHARLTRTSEGILVHAEHVVPVSLECARCLEETTSEVSGVLDEEFLSSTDVKTGLPAHVPVEADERPFIDEHHELDLDEILRQNVLTSLPLRPLCSAICPGLCTMCGQRLDSGHPRHSAAEQQEQAAPVDPASPFARLAALLKED